MNSHPRERIKVGGKEVLVASAADDKEKEFAAKPSEGHCHHNPTRVLPVAYTSMQSVFSMRFTIATQLRDYNRPIPQSPKVIDDRSRTLKITNNH